jgi:hypothetical protein
LNLYWVYDIPNWLFCLLTLSVTVGFSVIGLLLTRKWARRWIGEPPANNEAVNYYFASAGVFYGITLGMITVVAWDNFSEIEQASGQEAAALAALYHDVSSYPEPSRAQLRDQLREYTRYVIEVGWPAHRRGIIPHGNVERLDAFQQRLLSVELTTEGQQIMHTQAVKQFDRLVELWRGRRQSVTTGLSGVLWGVVVAGAILNIALTWLFVLNKLWVHVLLTAILSGLIALLIFMLAAMDNPYRGEFSISPEAFQIVYRQMMK